MLALVLVGVVPFSLFGLPSMFRSLFVLDAPGIMGVALFATMASFTFMATRRTVLLCGPRRFNVEWTYVGEDLKLASLLGHLLTAIPVIATTAWLSAAETDLTGPAALASAAKGVVGAFGAMLGVTLLYALLSDANRALPQIVLPDNPLVQAAHRQHLPERLHRQVVRLTADRWPRGSVRGVLRTWVGPGYFDDQGRVLPAHLFAAALLFVFIVLYVRGYVTWQPGTAAGAATPALVYILTIATLLTSLLAGVAFYFDRHRLPTLFVVGIWCLAVWSVSRADHYFSLAPARDPVTLLSPAVVAAARKHPLLIVVAADGGGIQASAWAATALTGIQERWPEFRQSVRLISGVSGGSVGTMFFVAALTKDGPGPERLAAVRSFPRQPQ
jgi:hypothetical protein